MDNDSAAPAKKDWHSIILTTLGSLCVGGYTFYFLGQMFIETVASAWGLAVVAAAPYLVTGALILALISVSFSIFLIKKILEAGSVAKLLVLAFIVTSISQLIYVIINW